MLLNFICMKLYGMYVALCNLLSSLNIISERFIQVDRYDASSFLQTATGIPPYESVTMYPLPS